MWLIAQLVDYSYRPYFWLAMVLIVLTIIAAAAIASYMGRERPAEQ